MDDLCEGRVRDLINLINPYKYEEFGEIRVFEEKDANIVKVNGPLFGVKEISVGVAITDAPFDESLNKIIISTIMDEFGLERALILGHGPSMAADEWQAFAMTSLQNFLCWEGMNRFKATVAIPGDKGWTTRPPVSRQKVTLPGSFDDLADFVVTQFHKKRGCAHVRDTRWIGAPGEDPPNSAIQFLNVYIAVPASSALRGLVEEEDQALLGQVIAVLPGGSPAKKGQSHNAVAFACMPGEVEGFLAEAEDGGTLTASIGERVGDQVVTGLDVGDAAAETETEGEIVGESAS